MTGDIPITIGTIHPNGTTAETPFLVSDDLQEATKGKDLFLNRYAVCNSDYTELPVVTDSSISDWF